MLDILYEIFGEALAYVIIVGSMLIFGSVGVVIEFIRDRLLRRQMRKDSEQRILQQERNLP